VDVFVDPVLTADGQGRTPTMLEQLQSALLNLEPLPHTPHELPADDSSVRFVQAHSAQREVEVLHDRLLAWLDADPTLKPSDIMVMVPDMANFAPHIHAVFGRFAHNAQHHDPRLLPYTVADTTPRTEPLVQALDTLLQLPQLRLTRVEWQSLFEVAAVRKRFGLEEHDVAQLDSWLADAGVRWGLDAPLPEQYVRYLAAVARGDFGRSFADNRDALGVVMERVPATLRLGGSLDNVIRWAGAATPADPAACAVRFRGQEFPNLCLNASRWG
jgi:exodeoxyribonuclease V gamma subunit